MAHYANIKYCDVANGTGVRTSVFISGCTHKCKNCFNEVAWDFNYGSELTDSVISDIINSCEPDYIDGITLLGGDPLCGEDNQNVSHTLCHIFKQRFPNKTVWLYTGYLYDQIKDLPVMEHVDVLVDGPYVDEKRNLMLKFRGTENQRLINIPETKKQDKIILLDI